MQADANIEAVYPVTQTQAWMLSRAVLIANPDEFNVQLSLELGGLLDVSVFQAAWDHVIARHDALRSCFAWQSVEQPVRVVRKRVQCPIDYRDVSGGGATQEDDDAAWQQVCEEDRAQVFELNHAPLMRIMLRRHGKQRVRLLWTHHHLILDGWSVPIVLGEVLDVYDRMVQAIQLEAGTLFQYEAYLDWLDKARTEYANDYWNDRLQRFRDVKGIPGTNTNRQTMPKFIERDFLLSATATRSLEKSARRLGVTANTLLQCAWAITQSRLTSAPDVLFGLVLAGRPPEISGIERAVGMFINALPFGLHVDASSKVIDALRAIHAHTAELLARQYLPLPDLRSAEQRAARERPFDVLFAPENFPANALQFHSTVLDVSEVVARECNDTPISIITTLGDRLRVQIIFDASVYGDWFANSILRMYVHIVEEVARKPYVEIMKLASLDPNDRSLMLLAARGDTADVPALRIDKMFEHQVRVQPLACALVSGEERVTYADLNRRANRFARYMRRIGVKPETFVAVVLERSAEAVIVLLATIKSGAAYVPLDPAHPSRRLSALLADAGPSLVVMRGSSANLVQCDVPVIDLDRDRTEIDVCDDNDLQVEGSIDQALYCLYTSGSTGLPKGVIGTHRATVNRLMWQQRSYPNTGGRIVHRSALGFVDSVWEVFGGLALGHTVVIMPAESMRDVTRLFQHVADLGGDNMISVASMVAVALQRDGQGPANEPQLRCLAIGGEPLPSDVGIALQQRLPGTCLLNVYGSTEIAGDAVACRFDHVDWEQSSATVPIGQPITNMAAYVLDQWLEPVPCGAIGEIYISGEGLARGYLGKQELTAERFVPDPFSACPGMRMYRTGDLARRRGDGRLEYLGRSDLQVKLRGHRLELMEVEMRLREHPLINDAVVLVTGSAADPERKLAAFVVRDPHTPVSVSGLRSWVGEVLPPYMVPTQWSFRATMPLTVNGKINRSALASELHAVAGGFVQQARHEPATQLEVTLTDVWSRVLHLGSVGVDDNFFDLGGNSLLLGKLSVELGKRLAREVSVMTLIRHPTIRSIAEHLQQVA